MAEEEQAESLGYREVAAPRIEYVKQMGFTHVEFMPGDMRFIRRGVTR